MVGSWVFARWRLGDVGEALSAGRRDSSSFEVASSEKDDRVGAEDDPTEAEGG